MTESTITTADTRRCHQCGRIGTAQFVPYPAKGFDYEFEGSRTEIQAGEWGWECANKDACRKRWPKTRDHDYESGE